MNYLRIIFWGNLIDKRENMQNAQNRKYPMDNSKDTHFLSKNYPHLKLLKIA